VRKKNKKNNGAWTNEDCTEQAYPVNSAVRNTADNITNDNTCVERMPQKIK
jgi:hypothetical protein